MTIENNDRSHTASADSGAAQNLSAHVFSSPTDFLSVLRSDFTQIAKSNPGALTKDDLLDFAAHGQDARGREAASIAANHYEDLQAIAAKIEKSVLHPEKGLTFNDLNDDIDMFNGRLDKVIGQRKGEDEKEIAAGAEGLITFVFVGAMLSDLSNWGWATVPLDLASAGACIDGIRRRVNEPHTAKTDAQGAQKMVSSWIQ